MAWDSAQLGNTSCPAEFYDLEGKYVYIRTNRSVFARALVTRETREGFNVRYVEMTNHKTGDVVTNSEFVDRADILSIRVYHN